MESFGAIAEAPGGIERLRGLVLNLAVRGQLQTQYLGDEHTESLIAGIWQIREALVAQKRIRRSENLPPVCAKDVPFVLPSTWTWTRLGEIGDWGAGATPSRSRPDYYGGSMPWLKSGELNGGHIADAEESVTELALSETSLRRNRPGDVLIAMYGATIGKTAVLDVEASTNQAICACTPFEGVYNEFLHLFLKAWRPRFVAHGEGGAQPNISRVKIVNTVFPLPPTAEQKRIVAKVDELMSMLDDLEQRQEKKRTAAIHVSKASLDSLVNAEDPDQLARAWDRVSKNFGVVVQGSLRSGLRTVLLQLATKGALSGRRFGEFGGASSTLPPDWRWFVTSDCLREPLCNGRSVPTEPGGFPVLRLSSIRGEVVDLTDHKEGAWRRADAEPWIVREGDYLVARGNGSMHLVGGGAWVGPTAGAEVAFPDTMIRVRPDEEIIGTKYFARLWSSPIVRAQLESRARTTSGIFKVSQADICAVRLPIPPLHEQHRLIETMDRLMGLIEHLDACIAMSSGAADRLAVIATHTV